MTSKWLVLSVSSHAWSELSRGGRLTSDLTELGSNRCQWHPYCDLLLHAIILVVVNLDSVVILVFIRGLEHVIISISCHRHAHLAKVKLLGASMMILLSAANNVPPRDHIDLLI